MNFLKIHLACVAAFNRTLARPNFAHSAPLRCTQTRQRLFNAEARRAQSRKSTSNYWMCTKCRLMFGVTVFCLLTLGGSQNLFAAGVQSVQALLEQKDRWPGLVGMPMQVEGHQTVLAKNYVKLKNCELTFRSMTPLPKLPGRSRVVEVSGRLAKDKDGLLFFEVDSIRELTADLETLRLKENGLRRSPNAFYELATWAAARGKFYDDQELIGRAKEINLKGVQLERQEMQPVTSAALIELAERARERGLDEALQFDFRHEAFRLEWDTLRKSATTVDLDAAELDVSRDPLFQFLKRLDAQFPEATERLPKPAPEASKEYTLSPVGSYREAEQPARRVLHRLFHVEVATAAINRWIKPDGGNGGEIAEQIEQLIPEQHEVAEQHRDRELTFLVKNAATLSRNQLQNLLERCRERKQEPLAKEAIQTWMKRREASLRKDGVTGLIQLADDRWTFLQDRAGTGGLLLEALKETPQDVEIVERLKKLGYEQINGEWRLPDGAVLPAKPADPRANETDLDRNIRLGIPSVEMTPVQILRCLGSPTSVTRIATSGSITETWTYREGTVIRQSVTIDRQRTIGKAKVIAIR